jgi:hypothetical protein
MFSDAEIAGSFAFKPADRARHQEINRVYY